jgi:hypothetical protein
VAHPDLLETLDLLSDQPVAETTLKAFCLNHDTFRLICGLSMGATETRKTRVAPSKIADSIAALIAHRRSFDYQQIRSLRSCSFPSCRPTRTARAHRLLLS